MELASEAPYTVANAKKAKCLGASSLIVKRVRIETRTVISDDYADFV